MKFHDNPNYLRDFITVVNLGLDAVPPAPADYANYLPSLVGKPLALVNTGWSLELATNPLQNQSLQSLNLPRKLYSPTNSHCVSVIPIVFLTD